VPSRHRSGAASAGRLIIHRATITLGLLLACADALAPSQREQLNIEDFRAKIRKIVADGATPSLVVTVARGGRILWSEGFGFDDREARVPATVDTPYSIASVTKPWISIDN
jgi:CubicO group peptidase (beta-lactamase class C family)